jgi:hypothetical protein
MLYKQKCCFSKTESRKVKQVLSGVGTSERQEDIRKGYSTVNMINIMYICVKMEK